MLEPSPYLQHVPRTLTDLSAACLVSVAVLIQGIYYDIHAQATMPDLILFSMFVLQPLPTCMACYSLLVYTLTVASLQSHSGSCCRYRMDYMKFVEYHREQNADITVGCLPIDYERASDFGLMNIDDQGVVTVRAFL